MRIQHILLTPEYTEYKIKSLQNLYNKGNQHKLAFFTLNPEVIIDYYIINNFEFAIRLKNKINKPTHLIYEIDYDYSNITKNYKNKLHQTYKSKKDIEDILIKIKKEYTDLNKNLNYIFYDDKDCIKFLKDYTDNYFVEIFNNISAGSIKADFWRIIVLYVWGGYYTDIDFVPYIPFNRINNNNDFIGVVDQSNRALFNAFLFSKPRHNILMDSILRFLEIDVKNIKWTIGAFQSCYDLLLSVKKEIYLTDPQKDIPHILFNGEYNNKKIKIIQELLCGDNVYCWYVCDNGTKCFKSRRDDYDYKTHKFINKENNSLITQ